MKWPDPNCQKSHKEGDVFRRWEHTPDCVRRAPAKIRKEQRIAEVKKDLQPLRPGRVSSNTPQ